jgi:hypothetical protein
MSTKGFTCTQAIFWEIDGSGPLSRKGLERVCKEQATNYSPAQFDAEFRGLLQNGLLRSVEMGDDSAPSYERA